MAVGRAAAQRGERLDVASGRGRDAPATDAPDTGTAGGVAPRPGTSDQRVQVDPHGERLGGGEGAAHRAGVRVPELAGEVVGGQRDTVAGLAESTTQ